MPTSSGAHSFKSSRSTRVTATARPIAAKAGSAISPTLHSLTTDIGSGPNLVIPGPTTEYEPRPSSVPDIPPSASFAAPAEVSSDGAVFAPSHGPEFVPVPSADDPLQGLIALVNHLSEKVYLLQEEVAALKTKETTSKDVIEGLRSSIHDLEDMFLREVAADTPSMEKKIVRERESKKNNTPLQGDVLARQNRKTRKASANYSSSEEESSSSDDEVAPQPEPRGARVPGLVEQITRRPEFKGLVSYRTYRLADTSQLVDASVTGKINAHLKRLKHYVDYKFSGDPAIQVLDFLRTFKEAADLNGISEGAAAVILPYFMEGRAKSGLASRMKHIPMMMPKFPAAVQWLLQSFATEPVIAASYQKVFTARQMPEEDEKLFAGRLNKYAAQAGSVFTEDALIAAYVDGLQPYASNTVRGQVTPTMTFAEVQILAEQAGNAGRALTSPTRASIRLPTTGLTPLRSKPIVAASALSPNPSWGISSEHGMLSPSPQVVATTGYDSNQENHSEVSVEGSAASQPSSLSAPTRGWASTTGSVQLDTALAVDARGRSCHLCFDPNHFLMDCPLLGSEAKLAAQQQRDQKFRDSPSPRRTPPTFSPSPSVPRILSRTPGPPRFGDYRRPAVAVHPVVENGSQQSMMPFSDTQPAENEKGDA
jgi:hypothetical protein